MIVKLAAVPNHDFDPSDYRAQIKIKPVFVEVSTFAEASYTCRMFIFANELGGGNWSGGQVFEGDEQIAHVSYNGRVWEGVSNPPHIGKEIKID